MIRIYGACSTDIANGELVAAEVEESWYQELGAEKVRHELRWDFVYASFDSALAELLTEMTAYVPDEELINTAKSQTADSVQLDPNLY